MQHFQFTESETSLTSSQGEGEVHSRLSLTGGVAVLSVAFAAMLFFAHEGALYRLNDLNVIKPHDAPSITNFEDGAGHQFTENKSLWVTQSQTSNVFEKAPDHRRFVVDSSSYLVSKLIKSSFLASPKSTSVNAKVVKSDSRIPTVEGLNSVQRKDQSLPSQYSSYGTFNDTQKAPFGVISDTQSAGGDKDTSVGGEDKLQKESRVTLVPRKPAESLFTPGPKYPNQAVRKLLEAEVNVSFVVNVYGEVEQVTFETMPNRHFARSIQRALKQWRFVPATLDGQKVDSRLSQTFSFSEPEKRLLYITGTRFPKVLKTNYLPKNYKS